MSHLIFTTELDSSSHRRSRNARTSAFLPHCCEEGRSLLDPPLPPPRFAHLLDQAGRDLGLLLGLEPVDGRIPPSNDLDDHEADVDPGPRNRLRDLAPEPRPI